MSLLTDLPTGQSAIITKVKGHGAFRRRMMEMGFIKGRVITSVLQAPMHDPIKYRLLGYEVSLRRSEASMVEVKFIEPHHVDSLHPDGLSTGFVPDSASDGAEHQEINVALIGNPNCGKTSLFNVASGAHEHVGNYSGVTVDFKKGHFDYHGYRINIVDLPGTYSLASYSPEELYVRNYLREESVDVIINVVVASNLERNLYLTTELIDMDRSMVIALNMYDELEASGDKLDYKMLGEMIGVPIVPTVSRTGEGLNNLFDTVISVFEGNNKDVRHVHITLNKNIEAAIKEISAAIKADTSFVPKFSPRYLSIKLLEGDQRVKEAIEGMKGGKQIIQIANNAVKTVERDSGDEDVSTMIAAEKYGFIEGALTETLVRGNHSDMKATEIIDAFVTNKLFGFPLFLLMMVAMFWLTFQVGQYPMDWIESAVGWIADACRQFIPEGALKDLVIDGIIGGVGGVIVFLPNIMILYICISFMEDSGYMARAAFIMDRMMHKIGLHGKSFIPLVMGFGCNVPAIMATRAIESRSSRLITIMINPFMSCSARLPIYVLLIGTFFSGHAALVFTFIYCLGIAVAMLTAKLLRKFWFHSDETPFVMELPPYRMPTAKATWRHAWAKGQQYLKKMGGIILLASIVVWALNYFPRKSEMSSADNQDSYLEMLGKAVTPVVEPLGWHWRSTVAAIAGIPAKEIVVSTLGVLYTGNDEADAQTLSERLTTPTYEATGNGNVVKEPPFTPASALGFMVFILLYCPCMATIVAVIRETHSWRYGAFTIIYNTAVAWIMAFVVYRIALLF